MTLRQYAQLGLCPYHCDQCSFLWLRSQVPSLHTLSSNVSREICTYLSRLPTLIALQNNSIVLRSLTNSHTSRFQLASPLPTQALFTHLTTNSVMCLGGQPVSADALVVVLRGTEAVTGHSRMLEARFWPGVIKLGPFIYVFGGKDKSGRAMVASERFSALDGEWKPLPRMSFSRVAFSPCLFANLIYLPEASSKRKPFESFNPSTLQYHRIPIYLVEPRFFGSVSFLISDTLCYISRSGRLGKWNVREIEQGKALGNCQLSETNLGLSCCSPVVLGKEGFWVRIDTGEMVTFHADSNQIVIREL